MYLRILCDNNSLIDQYYLAEPALSFYIEDGEKKILLDTGYSDVFKKNAEKMGIDLNQVNTIVFSHGHNDHTAGFVNLLNLKQNVEIVAHPNVDEYKEYECLDISCPVKLDSLSSNFTVIKTKESYKISKHITYLGQIERNVQQVEPLGNDYLYDDSALVYQNNKGIFIITGCSHSGICNIVEQAKKITGCSHILGIIGGFHLQNNPKATREVCHYFAKEEIEKCYPCHCTDLQAKIAISKVLPVIEVGVNTTIQLEDE